eukprot:1713366-Alexandrium_andersonii.AAC.1
MGQDDSGPVDVAQRLRRADVPGHQVGVASLCGLELRQPPPSARVGLAASSPQRLRQGATDEPVPATC